MAFQGAGKLLQTLKLAGAIVLFLTAVPPSPGQATEVQTNVGFFLSLRELFLFSSQSGQWTVVRLDPGERVLQRGVDGNVAAVVTTLRAIGFSSLLSATDEIRLVDEGAPDTLKVEGNVATFLTRRRALGFSAFTGKWAEVDRAFPGR